MPRSPSNVKKTRKNLEFPDSILEKADELESELGHASLSETLRYCISRVHHQVSCQKEGWELTMKKGDKERGVFYA